MSVLSTLHNGIFLTRTTLLPGTVVKIDPIDTRYVVKFSPDFIITNPMQYNSYIFSDIIEYDGIIYIVGYTSSTFFIQRKKGNETIEIELCKYNTRVISSKHIIFAQSKYLYALFQYTGSIIAVGNRPGVVNEGGILFTIDLDSLAVIGFQDIKITDPTFVFGSLYMLSGTLIRPFTPNTISSLYFSIPENSTSACVVDSIIIVTYPNTIRAYSPSGLFLWQCDIQANITGCLEINSKLYIISVVADTILISILEVSEKSCYITTQKSLDIINPVLISGLSAYTDGYIVWTNTNIIILNKLNEIISTFIMTNITASTIYRMIPPYIKDIIPIIINGYNTVSVNNITYFAGSEFAASFSLQAVFPYIAGMVNHVVNNTTVYAILCGQIQTTIPLLPNHIYTINKYGKLIPYSPNTIGRPFLIVNQDPFIYTIIYNNIPC